MKILVVGNGHVAKKGDKIFINAHTANFCSDVSDDQHSITYLQFSIDSSEHSNLLTGMLSSDIECQCVEMQTGPLKTLSYLKMFLLLSTILPNYDAIYIFYPGTLPMMAAILSRLFRKPYGLYVRGEVGLATKVSAYILKNSEFVLTVSDLLKEKLKLHNEKVEVIAPMIAFTEHHVITNRVYEQEGIFRCLYVGRLEHRKGTRELIQAIDKLISMNSRIEFHLVGGGKLYEEVLNKYQSNQNIKVYGLISDPKELINVYRSADLFVFPSYDEGFPRVLYEAMISAVPIVTTIVGGIGGMMVDGRNCLEIEVKSPDSIVRQVVYMMNNEEFRANLIKQATADILRLLNGSRRSHAEALKGCLSLICLA